MTESHGHESGQGHHGNHDKGWHEVHDHRHGPYWRRMHRDWRVWLGVTLMLIAMVIYILSLNESLRPGGGRLQQPMPAAPAP
jgi:hypothetical protein